MTWGPGFDKKTGGVWGGGRGGGRGGAFQYVRGVDPDSYTVVVRGVADLHR